MFEKDPDKSIEFEAGGAAALMDDDFATAGESEGEISTSPMSDKRGYVKSKEEAIATNPNGERSTGTVIAQLSDAASGVESEKEAAAVLGALSHTPGVDESKIAPEVLDKLLPDDEIVVLPQIQRVSGGTGYRIAKRLFDVSACGLALLVLAVPMALVSLIVRLESPGSAIFSQDRVGKDGKVFALYKFRSMYVGAEVKGAQWATEGDPRVTPFGRKIRKTRIDELPQFWNVLKGDMSLIGPRPERPTFSQEFAKRIDGWEQRLLVKPGISGLAQVKGGYELLPKEKALYDIEYIENRGIALDLKIIWATLRTMFTGDGAR